MSRGYRRFKAEVLDADAAFAKDGDQGHLRAIAERLRGLPESTDAPIADLRWTISGWSTRRRLVSRAALRRENPGWTIRLRRIRRRDIGAWPWQRPGFRVCATGSASLPAFRFVLADGEATPASAEVRDRIRRLAWPLRRRGTPTAYIEDIARGLDADDRPDRWIDALVCEHPSALWDFANSTEGAPWRRRFAEAVDTGVAERWADRYRLLLGGSSITPRSDLVALRVRRPIANDPAPIDGLPIPRLHREGDVVRPVPSSTIAPAPGSTWITVDDALIQAGGTVWSGNDLICYELAADPRNEAVAGQWNHVFGARANPDVALLQPAPPAPATLPEGILIGGRADDNWFHWMVDYLGRVLEIPAEIAPDVPILVSDRVSQAGLDALRELTDRVIVPLSASSASRIARLHLTAPVVQQIDDPRVAWASSFALRLPALRMLRERWGVSAAKAGDGRRVFLSRRSGIRRGLDNEAALADVARSCGLEVVDPATLTFTEQRALFLDSALVAGGSGAVMANYLFLRPGAEIIALTSRQLWDFVMPTVLAQVAGASFRYLTGPSAIRLSDVKNRTEWIHANFSIDPHLFRSELEAQLARSEQPTDATVMHPSR